MEAYFNQREKILIFLILIALSLITAELAIWNGYNPFWFSTSELFWGLVSLGVVIFLAVLGESEELIAIGIFVGIIFLGLVLFSVIIVAIEIIFQYWWLYLLGILLIISMPIARAVKEKSAREQEERQEAIELMEKFSRDIRSGYFFADEEMNFELLRLKNNFLEQQIDADTWAEKTEEGKKYWELSKKIVRNRTELEKQYRSRFTVGSAKLEYLELKKEIEKYDLRKKEQAIQKKKIEKEKKRIAEEKRIANQKRKDEKIRLENRIQALKTAGLPNHIDQSYLSKDLQDREYAQLFRFLRSNGAPDQSINDFDIVNDIDFLVFNGIISKEDGLYLINNRRHIELMARFKYRKITPSEAEKEVNFVKWLLDEMGFNDFPESVKKVVNGADPDTVAEMDQISGAEREIQQETTSEEKKKENVNKKSVLKDKNKPKRRKPRRRFVDE